MNRKKIIVIPGIFDIQYECKPIYRIVREMGFELVIFHYTSWGRESFYSVETKLEKFIRRHKPVGIIGYSHGASIALGVKHNLPVLSIGGTMSGTLTGYICNNIGFKQIRFGSEYLSHIRKMVADKLSKREPNKIMSIYTPFDVIIIPFTGSKVGKSTMVLAPLHQVICFWPKSKQIIRQFLVNLK